MGIYVSPPFMCVPIFVCMNVTSVSLCFISLYVKVCEFFCLVKCMFHSCGVTCHHFFCVSKWLWMYETLPNYVLLLICMLCSAMCISLTRRVLFSICCIYFPVSPFMSLSFAASECLWHSVSHSICIFVYFSVSLLDPSHCISAVVASEIVFLRACISVSAFFPVCISLSLSFFLCLWV